MGFPATTVDGKTVIITEKGSAGQTELLRTGNGDVYTRGPSGKLIPHPDNAPESNLEGLVRDVELQEKVDAIVAAEEPVGEILDEAPAETAIEVFEQMLNDHPPADVVEDASVPAEQFEAVGIDVEAVETEAADGEEAEAPEAA